jgi:hypothetical protein
MCIVIDRIVSGYLQAALDYSTDGDSDKPLSDQGLNLSSVSDDMRDEAKRDCEAFFEANSEALGDLECSEIGRLFFLSRSGHGTGFFDADALAEQHRDPMQEAARKAGEVWIYTGDDGLVYSSR